MSGCLLRGGSLRGPLPIGERTEAKPESAEAEEAREGEGGERGAHEKRSEGARRSLASCQRQYRGQRGRPEPPSRIVTIRHNPGSEIGRGELLKVEEKGLDGGRGEPSGELLEEEGEARGGEAELLGSIEEESTLIRGEHERGPQEKRSAERTERGSSTPRGMP